jgi:hypothetical protein
VAEIGDLGSGVRRLKPKCWVKSPSPKQQRSGERLGAIHLRGQVAEIERSRELGSSQGESPSIGYSKSRGREAREGG